MFPAMDIEFTLHEVLHDALDQLVSPRSSVGTQGQALATLERLLAEICAQPSSGVSSSLHTFIALQDTFQCNLPLRILSWTSVASSRLDSLTSTGDADPGRESETSILSSQLIQAMSIIQGVALIHKSSKQFLGRRYALEVLLDLFFVSRHVPFKPLSSSAPTSPKSGGCDSQSRNSSVIPLASAILDTLLCILVDSSAALRVLEELNGVQVVVKILKRAGTPREVRMKCLEFLYFYLLDETALSPDSSDHSPNAGYRINGSATSPVFNVPPASIPRLSHRLASSDSSMDSSTSGCLSITSFNTAPGSPALLPSPRVITPPNSRAQPRSLLMPRKEVDFVPLSPKKAQISMLGVGVARGKIRERTGPRGMSFQSSTEEAQGEDHETPLRYQTPRRKGHARGLSDLGPSDALAYIPLLEKEHAKASVNASRHRRAQSLADAAGSPRYGPAASSLAIPRRAACGDACARTMEEKKELLGTMLGNVDALVEGENSILDSMVAKRKQSLNSSDVAGKRIRTDGESLGSDPSSTPSAVSSEVQETDDSPKSDEELVRLLDCSSITSENDISLRFDQIASTLIHEYQINLNAGENRFSVLEIMELEFYLYSPHHPDPFTHRHEEQHKSCRWYFHRPPNSTTSFKAGTRKGLDLTMGNPVVLSSPYFSQPSAAPAAADSLHDHSIRGGILIRTVRRMIDSKVISGPSVIVDEILRTGDATSIHDLVVTKMRGDIFAFLAPGCESTSDPVTLHLKRKHPPRKERFRIFRSPRVGLDLSHSSIPKESAAQHPRARFISKPYRYFIEPHTLISNGRSQTFLGVYQACMESGLYDTEDALRAEIAKLARLKPPTVSKYLADYNYGLERSDLRPYLGAAGKQPTHSSFLRMMGTLQRI
ncbi:hypothetical protein A0H81_09582 [Grifola frondosa]|uniref:Cell division control protein 14 n=1 Tax=Grifola frondosa TaxID=5627 RepID=A0A1C7LZF5_GRIFR|nr:hypothetical protein A0H81_09582 [Grifola frondosa]